ncbi:hypothetical protein [Amycolatopsis granulosa]|uniref:hypothetical protein n=1 Tax=Amycolatopsis granulosa TaxID=185684 RepID=UPI001FBAA892|nr:hypothetical protein [Amycolatopsis granulosa]NIH85584.1 hypothetical protein [Amycolatopsis granulosa]
MTRGAEFTDSSRSGTGRHRRGAGTWTPVVPAHRAGAGRAPEPADPPAHGSLALTGLIPDTRPATEVFPPAHGELPVAGPAAPSRQTPEQPPRRTKVKLTPPRCRNDPDRVEDTDVRVYEVAPATGLGSFDLGNVPASVTPPRSWRKAAWFATASSGGVVVALMFAGSAFVAKPAPDQAGGGWIPGLGGGVPTLSGEQIAPPGPGGDESRTTASTPHGEATSPDPEPVSADAGPTGSAGVRAPGRSTVESTSSTGPATEPATAPPAATTPAVPRKPPPSPAPYDADPTRFTFTQEDPKKLASTSQSYLDTVTENAEAAQEMTGGELRQEGAEGLQRKYAQVAYFEVKHIRVHQYDGKTVCTVQTVYKDGRQVTEERTLEFAGGKITSDDA